MKAFKRRIFHKFCEKLKQLFINAVYAYINILFQIKIVQPLTYKLEIQTIAIIMQIVRRASYDRYSLFY